MMDTAFISVGLSLIALAGGMFLMAKINKDNLSIFFKIVAYFIIISSILNLGCSALSCMMKFYGTHHYHEAMMHKKYWKKSGKNYHYGMGKYEHAKVKDCCDKDRCYKECPCRDCYSMECISPGPAQSWRKEKLYREMKDSSDTKQ